MTESKPRKEKETVGPAPLEKHLLIDDVNITAMSKQMKVKIGAFLTNLMCKNLKFSIGEHQYLLLKPQVVKGSGVYDKSKYLQMDRSVPMIYPPAPWKNFFFGGYYLKQTKMAKVLP
jgi:DNA-directed RNA polymerase